MSKSETKVILYGYNISLTVEDAKKVIDQLSEQIKRQEAVNNA